MNPHHELTAAAKSMQFPTVDSFIEDGHKVGVRGVPGMGWPNRRAIVGLIPPTELVLRLRNEPPERLRE
jgi:hypothetical protein